MTRTVEYDAWISMIQRCTNPKYKEYEHYGGRGIAVCEDWRKSFTAFYLCMGQRPKGMTLDRINTEGNYEPSNVKWSTYREQNLNRRMNKNNSSGIVGVIWDEPNQKWKAQISVSRRTLNLGRFSDIQQAIAARLQAELKYQTLPTTNTTRTAVS